MSTKRAQLVSRAEYATLKGWQKSYVTKLAQAGRLVFSPDGKKVDVAASERKLRETSSVDKQGVREHHARKRSRARATVPPPAESVAPAAGESSPAGATVVPPPGAGAKNTDPTYDAYNEARAKREAALASMAEMDQRQREGQLVEVAQVRDAAQRIAGIIARGFEQVPPRIAAVWSTEQDPEKRERLLGDELRKIQQEFADGVQALFGETKGA